MHDPRIGRFFAIDPLAREYPWNSPYAFSENVVIHAVELEGLEKEVVINSQEKDPKTGESVPVTKSYTWESYNKNVLGVDPGTLPVNGQWGNWEKEHLLYG